jgi:hypothetical protein
LVGASTLLSFVVTRTNLFVAGRPLSWRDLASFDYPTYSSFLKMSTQTVYRNCFLLRACVAAPVVADIRC